MGGGLVALAIVFFGLTLPLIVEGVPIPTPKMLALISFWTLGILLTFVPLGAKLEVGADYIKTYLFNLTTTQKIYSSEVQVLQYGNIFRSGLGYGKGISFRVLKNGRSKAYNLSEAIYGKEAIAHARQVLEPHK